MIEKFNRDNIDEVMKIWLETNIQAHSFIDEGYWKDNFDLVKEMILDADIFIHKDEDIITGFIGIANSSYIAGIFIDERYQGQGIGSKLLDHVKGSYEELSLDVYGKNIDAVNFYRKNDFDIMSESKDEINDEVEYTMKWVN